MYDLLLNPYKLKNVELKNRLVVTAMVSNYCEEDGTLTERWIRAMVFHRPLCSSKNLLNLTLA